MSVYALKQISDVKLKDIVRHIAKRNSNSPAPDKAWNLTTCFAGAVALLLIVVNGYAPVKGIISPLAAHFTSLHHLTSGKDSKEVFGFAPYWNLQKLGNVDFNTLTTFAYFGVPVGTDGNLDTSDVGYQTFHSDTATNLFKKAHANNTRVVLTVTQMDNASIEAFLDNPQAQTTAISQIVDEVDKRGIDGANVDFEYTGTPDDHYRTAYSTFVGNLTSAIHQRVPGSQVSVSVYALAAKNKQLYDLTSLSHNSDKIFMMAYDFATTGADYAMPTAPLHGYKEGKYFYDVSTAVADFLKQIPANKLILGMPEYGYDYLVYDPGVKAETRPYYSWQGTPVSETASYVAANITPAKVGSSNYAQGWDSLGQVGWKAYYDNENETWRMIFIEDARSISAKVNFAKSQNLAGVGVWALGNDQGTNDIWGVFADAFGGTKFADRSISERQINETTY